MKIIIAFALLCFVATCMADVCSYSHCYKEELYKCDKSKDDGREKCNNQGGLFITYREGILSGSKHKCCRWRMEEIPSKNLYCVRNIRSATQKCTSEKEDYDFKYKTNNGCVTFSCNNIK